ncbi:MAG TPA: fibro-slime domain-containing protein, partial [Oculatellaceae cyanobacterium]
MSDQSPMKLNAIIRDFKADHPDFEADFFTERYSKLSGAETGIVKAKLGDDKKPVYNGDPNKGTATTSGKVNDDEPLPSYYKGTVPFDQWYRDVPNVNQRIEKTFDLKPSKVEHNGFRVYNFIDDNFFPINNEGFGNLPQQMFIDPNANPENLELTDIGKEVFRKNKEAGKNPSNSGDLEYYRGLNANYHFTLEAATTFTYQGKEKFSFYGDDDLWIFINNRLVIDLGGVHDSESGEIDLSLEREDNQATDKSTRLVLKLNKHLGIKQAEEDLELDLEVGQKYELRIFYAERHTRDSRCQITTSLQFEQPPVRPVRIDAIQDATEPYAIVPTFTMPGVPGRFRISLDKPAPVGGIRVKYELVNDNSPRTAIENVDFKLEPTEHEVVIPEGQKSAFINVIPLKDSLKEGKEAVVAKLIEPPQCGYSLGDKVQDTVFIRDRDPWVGDKIVCVAPVRTIVRREEEIVIIRRVRKVEEIDASPACPVNTSQVTPVQQEQEEPEKEEPEKDTPKPESLLRPGTAYVQDSVSSKLSNLYTLDLSSGKTTLIRELTTEVYDIAFVGDQLYGLDKKDDGKTMQLIKIDPLTGAWTVIGDIGYFVAGLAYNRARNTLYGSTEKQLIAIDTKTGIVTSVVTVANQDYNCGEVAFDRNGKAYITLLNKHKKKILAICDLNTGKVTNIGETEPNLGSLEFYGDDLYGVTGNFFDSKSGGRLLR